jgi:hypothetical protein
MRYLKLAGVSVVAAAALAGLTVSAAAAPPRLAILKPMTGAPAPNGYPNVAFVTFVASRSPVIACEQITEGTLLNNRHRGRDTLSGPFNDNCVEVTSENVVPATGYSLAGGFRRITLSYITREGRERAENDERPAFTGRAVLWDRDSNPGAEVRILSGA